MDKNGGIGKLFERDGLESNAGAQWRSEVEEVLATLVSLIDLRDSYTGGHCRRVGAYCKQIARCLELSPSEANKVILSAVLHDVGKIGIPDHVLLKKGPLTDEESEIVKKHPELGSMALGNVTEFADISEIILHHHEQFDGSGYPGKLRGLEIPLGARIIAVADTYDALTTDRPYRPRMSHDAAMELIRRTTGTSFDPAIVVAFVATRAVSVQVF